MTGSPIDTLADRYLELILSADPLMATLMGFREHDADLGDLSANHEESLAEARADLRRAALLVDPAGLAPQEQVTRSILLAQLDYDDAMASVDLPDFTVAAFPVSPSSVLLSYVRMVVATTPEQADAYLARLSRIPRYLAQAQERLERGRRAGLTPVAHLVQMAVDQIDRYLATEPNPLLIAAPTDWDDVERWHADLRAELAEDVNPAFVAYRDALVESALPTARSSDTPGLIHLPGGRARYEALVRVHTTTDRTPEELHDLGVRLVGDVHAEFRTLGRTLFDLDDVAAIFAHLQDDPALRWQSSEQILAAAETAVRRAESVSHEWFGRVPAAVCELEAIPELEAEGAAPAYYMPPALDGSRPGTYFTNVNRPTERTSFDLEAVAYHEAVPGHHFQISLALELDGLPRLRQLPLFTAYVEGWGLYSERLADEMGLYSSPLQRMGMLSAEVWRAARLVVDTGLHALGWTRQQAIDYMIENTPVAPLDVESEVDRYIAYPGQALSYMTGRLEIERLRALAQEALGDRFDIRDFHDTVLSSGALPLSVLADVIDDWITESIGG